MGLVPVDAVLNLLEPDFDRLAEGRARMAGVWRNESLDSLPVLVGDAVPERSEYPRYSLAEQFDDPEKMLYEHAWGMIATARGVGDGQLAMRANFGVGLVPSVFGLRSTFVQEEQMPWVIDRLSKEEIEAGEVPDVRSAGLIPKAVEYIGYFREKLDGKARVYLSDTQGPFDIAHLLRGPEIYLDVVGDPRFVHRLMELATAAYIEVSKVLKDAVGERLDAGYHGGIYMENGGVRVCDDSSVNISDTMFREFVAPYIARAFAPFGGGWYHVCGSVHHLLDSLMEIEGLRGINFGNPERYDFGDVLLKLIERERFYTGPIPKAPEEDTSAYVDRVVGYLNGTRRGLILQGLPTDPGTTGMDAVRTWRARLA